MSDLEAFLDSTPMSEEQRAILKQGAAMIQMQRQLTELAKVVEGLKARIEVLEKRPVKRLADIQIAES